MKTSVSFLNINTTFSKTLKLINESKVDFIHVDVADGLLVNNVTHFDKEMLDILKKSRKPKEVHLMTLHLKKYIDLFMYLNPETIIYEFEATTNHDKVIKYIKNKNVKVGIAISPLTNLDLLVPYLKKIDMVLVMAIIPGYGGQKFLPVTLERIKKLEEIKKEKNLSFLISIDGGINDNSIELLKTSKLDRIVAGSYICKSTNFNRQIEKIKNTLSQ